MCVCVCFFDSICFVSIFIVELGSVSFHFTALYVIHLIYRLRYNVIIIIIYFFHCVFYQRDETRYACICKRNTHQNVHSEIEAPPLTRKKESYKCYKRWQTSMDRYLPSVVRTRKTHSNGAPMRTFNSSYIGGRICFWTLHSICFGKNGASDWLREFDDEADGTARENNTNIKPWWYGWKLCTHLIGNLFKRWRSLFHWCCISHWLTYTKASNIRMYTFKWANTVVFFVPTSFSFRLIRLALQTESHALSR